MPLDQSRGESAHFWPYFLPDGKHFLYQSWTGRSDDSAIYVTSLDGGDRKQLVKVDSNAAYAPPGFLLFARTNTLLAQPFDPRSLSLSGEPIQVSDVVTFTDFYSLSSFSISDNGLLVMIAGRIGNRQLAWFDRNGKQLGVVGAPAEYNDVVLSPDGKRVAVQRIDSNGSDVWMIDADRALPSRFTFDLVNDDPVWSSDGNTLLFSKSKNGIFNIFKRLTNGSGKDELVCSTAESKEGSDLSPDGKFLLMDVYDSQGNLSLWVLPMFGDYKPYPLLNSNFREGQGHFSPDGKWFAYISDESGSTELYLRRFPECDNQVRVSNGGGAQPHWRKDGRELFYVATDRKVMAVDVKLGATAEVGTPKPLFTAGVLRYDAPNRYAVSADGQRFLVNTTVQTTNETPITVVLNWSAGLKK
jgi:Tol biopolymer transport system component